MTRCAIFSSKFKAGRCLDEHGGGTTARQRLTNSCSFQYLHVGIELYTPTSCTQKPKPDGEKRAIHLYSNTSSHV
uniref:Uncharacterized protein n=1 Tax=Arundo donax TaxID=35708 RepID=A0A0A8YTR9_ARUDO